MNVVQIRCDKLWETMQHTFKWYVPLGRMSMQTMIQNIPADVLHRRTSLQYSTTNNISLHAELYLNVWPAASNTTAKWVGAGSSSSRSKTVRMKANRMPVSSPVLAFRRTSLNPKWER